MITHCVAHPTRGPLSGFFRGGVSASRGEPPYRSPPGILSCPAHGTRASPRPLSHGGPFLPACPRGNSLLRPPGAPKEPHLGPARGGQLSQGKVQGRCALQLFLRLPSSKAWGRGFARWRTRRGGMKWEGERWAKTGGTRAPMAWGGREGDF